MDILNYTFFQHALLGVVFVSLATAIIGTYVVARRMVFITGGITHASFGGLGLGFYAGWNPVVTAAVFAIASALGVEMLTTREHVREDTAIGVVWALGMALGTIFIFLTPGYVPELTTFLFGNILTITRVDLIAFAIFLVVLLVLFLLFYRPIVACAFDRDFASTHGIPVRAINLMMTVLTSVCIVLTIRLIGIMMLMSLLTVPQMIAELHVKRFVPMMVLSGIVSLVCSVAGLILSAMISVPVSASIVLILIIIYIINRSLESLIKYIHSKKTS